MNVRFAEALIRDNPLKFDGYEGDVFEKSTRDGRTDKQLQLTCEKDVYIGVFFDGTNNNKYRDTPNFSHSNVARLYEAYPGTPAMQTPLPPTQEDVYGRTKTRAVFRDEAFKPSNIDAIDFPYYRKIYIPGVGTPMLDVGDTGTVIQKTGGLAMALLGQVRLDWALLQLINQVHAAIMGKAISPSVDMRPLYKEVGKKTSYVAKMVGFIPAMIAEYKLEKPLDEVLAEMYSKVGQYDKEAFNSLLASYVEKLKIALLKRKGNNIKPTIRKIRLSVFGFSRGSAEARAWVNMVNAHFNTATFEGIQLQIDFLGIFDTVASVGLAQSTPHFEGHGAWADNGMMEIPGNVKRCAHLVAAFEVRGSFPLDSVCRSGVLPVNCKEIVYPGVHSDVGGGYPPNDQGRALGEGAAGDAKKISQIPLAQMYREARMAGVPLASTSEMLGYRLRNFAIDKDLKADFNAYVAATRTGTIPATNGVGQADFVRMFPTETQPREDLFRIMRHHAGILLRWRKGMLSQTGGVAVTVDVTKLTASSRFQDREDLSGAEAELKKEIAFLNNKSTDKFKTVDDVFFDKYLYQISDDVARGSISVGFALKSPYVPALLYALSLGIKGSVEAVMKEKQHQWDTWLREEWHRNIETPSAVDRLFKNYVHDSRAWFKALMCSDTEELAADDETWFTLGGYDSIRNSRRKQLTQQIQDATYYRATIDPKNKKTLFENQEMIDSRKNALKKLEETGAPLLRGAREPYRMWGYVRHRKIYENGVIPAKLENSYANYHKSIEQAEDSRRKQQQRTDLINQENAAYEKEIKEFKANANESLKSRQRTTQEEIEYRDSIRGVLDSRQRQHQEILKKIEDMTH